MDAKNWWESRTLWFNAVAVLVVGAGFIADNTGALALPPQTTLYAMLVVAMGNAILRLGTGQPISGTPAAKPSPMAPPTPLTPTSLDPKSPLR